MKKNIHATVALCFFCLASYAQTTVYATLDINQVRTVANADGDLFWNHTNPRYEVPQGSGAHSIFAGAAWIGGLDAGGTLHLGAQTYRQSGDDFFQGPVMDSAAYTMQQNAIWNHVWKINKASIDSLIMWHTNPALFPNYAIPYEIASWPGNGNVNLGQAAQLAPYIDLNGDGVYSPQNGDYPCIKGDQCLYFIINDYRDVHTETGGAKMKVEIHGMMYAYSAPGTWLDSTVFLNYKVYNRSNNTYQEMYWGQWTDFDLGDPFDDYVGCDVERNIAYVYNGRMNDGGSASPGQGTYGANPPAQGVVFLKGPEADAGDGIDNDRDGITDEAGEVCLMNHFLYYENDFSARGNPENAPDYYGYMKGDWKDSTHVTYGGNGYGGSTNCDFMFPGASDPLGWGTNFVPQPNWDELSSGNSPHDRRGLGSAGPFTLVPAQNVCLDFAYVFGRGNNGPSSSVTAMQNAADSAHIFYAQNNPCSCDENPLGVEQHEQTVIGVYPNPANESINIICGDNSVGSTVEIIDVNGKVVKTATVLSGNSVIVSTSDLAAGVYFVRVTRGTSVMTGKFMRQ